MSKIQERIAEIDKASKKSRLINNILWVIVFGLVGLSGYFYLDALNSKKEAIANEEIAKIAKEEAEGLQHDLENLIAKNKKLEFDKVNQDDLWNYAKEQNNIEAYVNYLEIKGNDSDKLDSVSLKLNEFLKKSGFVQLLDSDGVTKYFSEYNKIPNRKDLWIASSARSVRGGVIGKDSKSKSARNGDVILKDQIVAVEGDIIISGDATWAKINYAQ